MGFYIHRFFRIAPMYYFGALIYFFIRPPGENFDFSQLFLSLSFINGWSPAWLPTTDVDWQVVPGGWSISVEFCFYFLFPFLVAFVKNFRHAFVFVFFGMSLLAVAHPVGEYSLSGKYSEQAIDNFLFFWLPNQLVIFGFGFFLYFLVVSRNVFIEKSKRFLGENNQMVFVVFLVSVVLLAQFGNLKYFSSGFPWFPTHVLISLMFVILLFSLLHAEKPTVLFVNSFTTKMGEVSFCAYVLHFAVIGWLHSFPDALSLGAEGLMAIFHFVVVLTLVIAVTYMLSRVTYLAIEMPFVKLGRAMTRR